MSGETAADATVAASPVNAERRRWRVTGILYAVGFVIFVVGFVFQFGVEPWTEVVGNAFAVGAWPILVVAGVIDLVRSREPRSTEGQ